MKTILRATAIAMLSGLPALAQDEKLDCDARAPDQMTLNRCAVRRYQAIDAKLNEVYRTMIKKYDARNRALLLASEKAWLAYRDAECTFETAPVEGGSFHTLVYYECLSGMTTRRVNELNEQLNCQEGNLSCNAPR